MAHRERAIGLQQRIASIAVHLRRTLVTVDRRFKGAIFALHIGDQRPAISRTLKVTRQAEADLGIAQSLDRAIQFAIVIGSNTVLVAFLGTLAVVSFFAWSFASIDICLKPQT